MPQPLAVLLLTLTLTATTASGADWPIYRHDTQSSATTDESLNLPLSLNWRFQPSHAPKPAWPPSAETVDRRRENRVHRVTIAGDTLCFASPIDDTVHALDTRSAKLLWKFTADGPVRFAPTFHAGKVYFGSDDGHAYCLDADDGSLIWQRLAGPSERRLLGNGRMISMWPVRTNVLVDSGVAYFGSGVFPYEGTYLWAVDAQSGEVHWRIDMRENVADFKAKVGFSSLKTGGRAPHGYLAADHATLFLPTGRGMPMAFDKRTGKFRFEAGGEPGFERAGGSWMTLLDGRLFSGMGDSRARDQKACYDIATGEIVANEFGLFPGQDIVASPTRGFSMTREGIVAIDRARYRALSADQLPPSAKTRDELHCWTFPKTDLRSIMLAGDVLFAGGDGQVLALDTESGEQLWQADLDGQAYGLAIASERLFVSTDLGPIYCFTPGTSGTGQQVSLARPESTKTADPLQSKYEAAAERIVQQTGIERGWCLVLDGNTGRLAQELAKRTELQFLVLEDDPENVRTARESLHRVGLYGSRIAVESWTPGSLPDYFANLIVSDEMVLSGQTDDAWETVSHTLRPCGGQAVFRRPDGTWSKTTRGPLEGADAWTHLYADEHNTGVSADRELRGPLEVLWFGEPGEQGLIDRHGRGMGPLSMDGRLFVEGEESIWAYDAYNGTPLWQREIPGAFRVRVDVDAGNMALGPDGLFVAVYDQCHRLDPASGVTLAIYEMPLASEGRPRRWGYIGLKDGLLIGSASPPLNEYAAMWKAYVDEDRQRWRDDSEVPEAIREWRSWPHRWWFHCEGDPQPGPGTTLSGMVRWFKETYPVPNELARRAMHKSFNLFEPVGLYPAWDPLMGLENAVTPQLNTVASEAVFALDARTGEPQWVFRGRLIPNVAITLGEDRVFLIEEAQSTEKREQALARRGEQINRRVYEKGPEADVRPKDIDVRHVVALDLQSGETIWENHTDLTGCGGEKTSLAWKDGVLLFIGQFQLKDLNGLYRRGGLAWRRITALNGSDGTMLWSRPLNYSHRPPILGQSILAEPRAVDLRTGQTTMRPHPISGRPVPFLLDRMGKNCAPIQGSEQMLFFRKQDIEMFDFEKDLGLTRIGGMRPSCWINMIVANGLALFPEGASGCSCPYSVRTSFVMKPKTDDTLGAWSAFTRGGDLLPVEHLAINLGAPGDHRSTDGRMWFGYPRPGGVESLVEFDLAEVSQAGLGPYRTDHRFMDLTPEQRPWLFASGILGLKRLEIPLIDDGSAVYTVRLGFRALEGDEAGQRVFDIKLQGKTVRKRFDICGQATGPGEPVIEEFANLRVDGLLRLELIPALADPGKDHAPVVQFVEVIEAE